VRDEGLDRNVVIAALAREADEGYLTVKFPLRGPERSFLHGAPPPRISLPTARFDIEQAQGGLLVWSAVIEGR
jgi:hypothetical protein